jgi:outer membrane protein OmpA-like peptidoglycan-associated protein
MENVVRKDTVGKVEEIDAKYEFLRRGQYTVNVLPADLKPVPLDKNAQLQPAAEARSDANQAERERAAAQALADRTKLAALASERTANDARAEAQRSRMDAELAAQRALSAKQAVEAANEQARRAAAEQAEREKQELRSKLTVQLNSILETKDSARGLIVNMSDVLFDTGQYSLKAGAREKLAKISGIVLAYPSLMLEVEGHTDSVGIEDLNLRLSKNRANSVRDFLIGQGVVQSSIGARGYGESQPVATNDTSTGRQQNRRVELIVSGEVIGSPIAGAVATPLR